MMLREKPGAKGYILCNSIGVKCPEQARPGFRQPISWLPRLGQGGRVTTVGTRGLTGMIDCGDCYTTVLIINSHLVITFKRVNCVACKLHQDTTAISLIGPWSTLALRSVSFLMLLL